MQFLSPSRVARLSAKNRAIYEEDLKIYRDTYSVMETAIKEAEMKGMTEAILKGEIEAKLEIALNLFDDGFEVSYIARVTKLPEAEVLKHLQESGKI
jgi:predicted transposase/invertase (TIGR01784 family)